MASSRTPTHLRPLDRRCKLGNVSAEEFGDPSVNSDKAPGDAGAPLFDEGEALRTRGSEIPPP